MTTNRNLTNNFGEDTNEIADINRADEEEVRSLEKWEQKSKGNILSKIDKISHV